ncbi:MAG: DUF3857 domain-containing protein [Bacteroidales bacterium]|nr:DUF3857 domain-containing protein [Bacteroidales bacterium]
MKKLILFSLLLLSLNIQASIIDDIYKALETGDRKQARTLIDQAILKPESKVDAQFILMLLNIIDNKKDIYKVMEKAYPSLSDPSPYLYSLWFTDALTGGYGKKETGRLETIKKMLLGPKASGSIQAAAKYVIGAHYLFSNNFEEAQKVWSEVGSIKEWQMTGPFDNTSGSGFNKKYPPIDQPQPDASFISATNSKIGWFRSAAFQKDPWTAIGNHVVAGQAIVYAQTFLNSPMDMDVTLSLGGSGSLKLWINDNMVIENEDEFVTELDIYNSKVKLKKGNNRILIQLGYTQNTAYPNYILRVVDSKYQPIKGLTYSSIYKPYPKAKEEVTNPKIEHFAESFFKKKIAEQPNNIINYILLSKAYFRRSDVNKAIDVLNKALKIYPNNILTNYELILNYNKIDNRTELLKQIERLRKIDPNLYFFAVYDYNISYNKGNYVEAEEHLNKIKELSGAFNEDYIQCQMKVLAAKKDYQKLISVLRDALNSYPENQYFTTVGYYLIKEQSKSTDDAAKFLEAYLAKNFNYEILELLVKEYENLGKKSKIEQLLIKQYQFFPEETKSTNNLTSFYYKNEKFKKGLEIVEKALLNIPYSPSYWHDKAFFQEALGMKAEAIADLEKAINYNPNLFEAREKLREYQGKKPLVSYFKIEDAYKDIEKALADPLKSDDNYEYIFYNQSFVVFPEGASVEYSSSSIRMLNNSGIEKWKETSIPYNRSTDNLIIEKAEVVKKNGEKVTAEQNYNDLVFPSLEVGDAIYYEYRIERYTYGKLRKEFWNDFVFNDYVPTRKSMFKIFTPQDYKFEIKTNLIDTKPKTYSVDDYKCYEWSFADPKKCISESYMPTLSEVGMTLSISTVKDWKTISHWYSDLVMPIAKEDYNVNEIYNKIFENKIELSNFEKAKAIYEFICTNIRYSSVDFRQSSFVPLKPMVTVSTQLGDCKDLSTLFFTLARKAGIKTNLVLVNTRDKGEEAIKLPSINFNHCIVKIDIDGKTLFQELTDNYLPFGYVPTKLQNSQALIIPNSETDTVGNSLIHIPNTSIDKSKYKREINVKIEDDQLKATTKLTAFGNLAESYRYDYSGLTNDEIKEKIVKRISNEYSGAPKLNSYNIENLDNRNETVTISSDYTIENKIIELGGLKAIKPVFFEDIFTTNAFLEEKRTQPILYWKYEDCDYYETEVTLELPNGLNFMDLPANFKLDKSYIKYSLEIVKLAGNKVKLIRKVSVNNATLPASIYTDFKQTMKVILKAEDIYLAFK